MKRSSFNATLLLLVSMAVVAGCGDGSSGPANALADLRLLHATASLGALDLSVAGETPITGLSFGNASTIAKVPAGAQHLVVRSGGTLVGELDVLLSTQHINAVVVSNGVPQFSEEVIPDTGAVLPNRAMLRLVNVASSNTTPPTALDVLINSTSVPADSTARLGGYDATVARYWSLLYFDPGHIRVRYVPAGTTTVLTEVEMDIIAGQKKAAILERDANGTYRVSVVIEP